MPNEVRRRLIHSSFGFRHSSFLVLHSEQNVRLNEFPQLWNVLIGEMSLVGPRPEDPEISKTWPAKAARELLSVRPGVTSPASILYRDEENMLPAGDVMRKYLHELSPDKMRLDQHEIGLVQPAQQIIERPPAGAVLLSRNH